MQQAGAVVTTAQSAIYEIMVMNDIQALYTASKFTAANLLPREFRRLSSKRCGISFPTNPHNAHQGDATHPNFKSCLPLVKELSNFYNNEAY